MSDNGSIPNRRQQDIKIGELIVAIEKHGHDLDLLVNLVAGKMILDPFTDLPTGKREEGMDNRLTRLEYNANGGTGLSIRGRDKIIISFITAGLLVIAEILHAVIR